MKFLSLFFMVLLLLPVFSGSATEPEHINLIVKGTGGKINCVGTKKLLQVKDFMDERRKEAIVASLPYGRFLPPHTYYIRSGDNNPLFMKLYNKDSIYPFISRKQEAINLYCRNYIRAIIEGADHSELCRDFPFIYRHPEEDQCDHR